MTFVCWSAFYDCLKNESEKRNEKKKCIFGVFIKLFITCAESKWERPTIKGQERKANRIWVFLSRARSEKNCTFFMLNICNCTVGNIGMFNQKKITNETMDKSNKPSKYKIAWWKGLERQKTNAKNKREMKTNKV